MDMDQYSRETFVNHVTEQSTYGVLNLIDEERVEEEAFICIFTLRGSRNDYGNNP